MATFTAIDAEAAGWKHSLVDDGFKFRRTTDRSVVSFDNWPAHGRWHGHRKVNGRITDDYSYASRRSIMRAVLQRIARED